MVSTALAARGTVGQSPSRSRPSPASTVWVGVVGPLLVRRDDRPLAPPEVGSRKARTLLALLAVEQGHPLSVERVAEALWGGIPPQRPAENVATLISRLRASLGRQAIAGQRTGYWLGEPVRVDLREAATLHADVEARIHAGDPVQGLAAARQCLRLLDSGGVLDEMPEADWAEPARAHHAVLLRRARHAVARAALRTGDARLAARPAEAAFLADPYDETACRLLMRAHDAAGEPARAAAAYGRLRRILAADLGIDPAAETRRLHLAILRGVRSPRHR